MGTDFEEKRRKNIEALGEDSLATSLSLEWMIRTSMNNYSYNFSWLGRPIIQFPQDIVAMQEIIWHVKPDLVIETGVAHGGSLVLYASLLELIGGKSRVLGIDIELRPHNRRAIEEHPLSKRIALIEGSSTDRAVVGQAQAFAKCAKSVLVALDSNHTHEHVLKELELYSPLVTKGSYLVVFDTIIEEFPANFFVDRPWDRGNNPMTAVKAFLKKNDRFVIDTGFDAKLLITVAKNGYLKCVKG